MTINSMIYVNGRFLLQNLTGVNRFAYEICKAWVDLGIDFKICCPPGKIKDCYDVSAFTIIVCGCGKSHIWEQFSLPICFVRIKGEKILVNLTSLGPLFVWRKVMTIHDLAFMVNPKWYSRSYLLLYKFMTPLCAKTSLHIITVSNFSKNEIINRLFINRKKISVIYNAVSNFFLDNSTDTHGLIEEKYILAVSSIDPRKNFSILLKAFDRIKDANVKLYIIGGQNSIYSTTISELSRVCVSERIKWLGRVSDTELKIFYSNALCFVYPSLYEGFGIPPLEAMASGTPTIVSNIPPLKEVCADASLYVNPKDEFDIADKINLLVSNPTLRRHLIMKGFERCQYFNWHRSAESLFHKIDRLLRENM